MAQEIQESGNIITSFATNDYYVVVRNGVFKRQLAILVPRVFNVKAYGAVGDGVTDDSAAIQAAMQACHNAGGGIVYFPMGIYLLNNAPVTSVDGINPNAQLYIPLTESGTEMRRIVLKGEAPPNWASEGISSSVRNTMGVIIKSNILTSGAYVLGSSFDPGAPYGAFNYAYVDVENIVFQVRSKTGSTHVQPQVSGINFGNVVACTFKNVCVYTESGATDLVAPAPGLNGIVFPIVNNKAICRAELLKVEGFYNGLIITEHFTGDMLIFNACFNGLRTSLGYHKNHINHMNAENCKNAIYIGGDAEMTIMSYDVEHKVTGSEFYVYNKDIAWNGAGLTEPFIFHSSITNGGGGTGTFNSETAYKMVYGTGANSGL